MVSAPTPPRAVVHGIGLALPADWWVVPLADEAARGRAIADLVERQVGAGESTASLRRELRALLGAAARRAAAHGGWCTAFMLHAGPHPLPATLTAYRTRGSLRDERDVASVQEGIVSAVDPASGSVEVTEGPFGTVLRAVRHRTGAWHGSGEVPLLAVDHWTDPADGHGLVHLAFRTPVLGLQDAWLDLADTVAATLHRTAAAHEPAG